MLTATTIRFMMARRCTDRFDSGLSFTQRRKDAKVLFREAIDEALNPIFHQVGAEIEQKPKLKSFEL